MVILFITLVTLIVSLWPLWLWYFARRYAASLASGTPFVSEAEAAVSLVILGVAMLLAGLNAMPRQVRWWAVLGAMVSGYMGIRDQWTIWAANGFSLFANGMDSFLIFVCLLCFASPVLVILQDRGKLNFFGGKKSHFGSAQWMSILNAWKLYGKGALIFGEAYSPRRFPRLGGLMPLLRCPADKGHLLTVSGTRGGKTSSIAVPNCLSWDGPMVVHDPKGELAALCRKAQKSKDRPIIQLKPSENLDRDGINVLDWLNPDSPQVVEDVKAVAGAFNKGEEPRGQNAYFINQALNLIQCFILEVICSPDVPASMKTLSTVRSMISSEEIIDILRHIMDKGPAYAFGAPHQYASDLYTLARDSGKVWADVKSQASEMTAWLSIPTLAALVCEQENKTASIKEIVQGDADLFISVPVKTLSSTPQISRVIFSTLLTAYYEFNTNPLHRTLFLIDEMPRLGYMAELETARDVGAGYGIVLWVIVQDMGQLEKAYGEPGVRGWMESCYLKNFFGISELKTAEMLSNMLGKSTIRYTTRSGSTSGGIKAVLGGGNTDSQSDQYKERSLLDPAELMRLTSDENGVPDEQIVFIRNQYPIRCGMAKWYRRAEWEDLKSS